MEMKQFRDLRCEGLQLIRSTELQIRRAHAEDYDTRRVPDGLGASTARARNEFFEFLESSSCSAAQRGVEREAAHVWEHFQEHVRNNNIGDETVKMRRELFNELGFSVGPLSNEACNFCNSPEHIVSEPPPCEGGDANDDADDDDEFDQTLVVHMDADHRMSVGLAGEEEPRWQVQMCVGRSRHGGEVVACDAAWAQWESMHLTSPIERGVVTSWHDLERVWRHIYFNEVRVDPKKHAVCLVEPILNPKSQRECLLKMLFDTFNAPAVILCSAGVLALYSSGRTTGITAAVGETVTEIMPIWEGYALINAVARLDIGARDITDHFIELLVRHGSFNFASVEEARIICEEIDFRKNYFVAEDFDRELHTVGEERCLGSSKYVPAPTAVEGVVKVFLVSGEVVELAGEFETVKDLQSAMLRTRPLPLSMCYHIQSDDCPLEGSQAVPETHLTAVVGPQSYPFKSNWACPDGRSMSYGSACFRAPEVLFQPCLLGREGLSEGLPDAIMMSIQRADIDTRRDLMSNIVLAGQATKIANLPERLCGDLKALCFQRGFKDVLKVIAPPERAFGVWIGGSILASLSSTTSHWIRRAQFQKSKEEHALGNCAERAMMPLGTMHSF